MITNDAWDAWDCPSRRGWTTLLSFTLQIAALGLLLLAPILYTSASPQFDLVRRVFVPLPPAGKQFSSAPRTSARPNSISLGTVLLTPSNNSTRVVQPDNSGISPLSTGGIGVPFGTGVVSRSNAVIGSIGQSIQPFIPKPPAPIARPARVSAMMQGLLIHKVEPVYPPLARAARIQGSVELQAVISKDGRIERLQVLRGHPMLVKAAVEAVQQWRYQPYLLNGEAIEVETRVTVNFSLLGG